MKKLSSLLKESQYLDYRRLNIGEDGLGNTEMTPEEKLEFLEAVASYRKIGEAIYHNGNLIEAYENIKKIVETAQTLTLKETTDWFDKVTVNRHMKSMNESFKVFSNTIKEVAPLQQRLESTYDEIGEVLSKYYEIREGNAFGAERAKAIAGGESSFNVDGKQFKVTGVDAADKQNAKQFVGENMSNMKLSSFIKNKRSVNEANDKLMKVGATMMVGGDGSGMVKPVKMKLVSIDYLPKEDKYSYKFQGGGRTQYYTDDVLAKKLKESVNEAKVIVYNEKTGERYEVLSGKGKGDLIIAMKALQSAAPSHMKYSIKENQSVNETKFYAFWGNKKHEIEANDLWDAKQKAITMLKVPKSKVGLLAVVNAKAHDGGSFMYEKQSVNEGQYAERAEKDKAAIIKKINDLIKRGESREEAIARTLEDGRNPYFPHNDDDYHNFLNSIKDKILDRGLSSELPKASIPAAIEQRLALALQKIESGKLNFNQ